MSEYEFALLQKIIAIYLKTVSLMISINLKLNTLIRELELKFLEKNKYN